MNNVLDCRFNGNISKKIALSLKKYVLKILLNLMI